MLYTDCSSIKATEVETDKNIVYICASKNGKRYHFTKNCRGLSNCRAKIVKTTIYKAKKQGKTLCGWED
ncbi:hypothetical protein C4F49_03235 [Sphingobacterium sp. KB22]|uniref:Uncharacterized protein n=1 Tax=Sphingobacterium hungaricum TaxID=2082723 RepID=A0A928YP90_9SPHI|nr:hypothetical protein [Sphingobacterium hungaricum]